jgi:hypothetical protein
VHRLAFDLPVTEQGIGNWTALIGVVSHGVAFADRLRFRINDLNADIDSGAIDVTTGPDSVNLSIRLQSDKPTIVCEANTYTFLPFAVIAIPVGWRSEFCPQVDMTNIVVTVSFVSAVVDGQLSYNDARVVLNADISAGTLGDALQPIVDFRSQIKSGFESQVQKMALGSGFRSALTRLFMQMVSGQAQKTIANITSVSVDQSGLVAEYPLQPWTLCNFGRMLIGPLVVALVGPASRTQRGGPDVRSGSWLCGNAATRERGRRNVRLNCR